MLLVGVTYAFDFELTGGSDVALLDFLTGVIVLLLPDFRGAGFFGEFFLDWEEVLATGGAELLIWVASNLVNNFSISRSWV